MKKPVRYLFSRAVGAVAILCCSLLLSMSPADLRTLSNEQLTVRVNPTGAELQSIMANATGHEYLWQGDPAFWARRSPILFPIVGNLWRDELRYAGSTYHMTLHGFARDREFELIVDRPTEVRYRLVSDEQTLGVYPFPFSLEIGYRLSDNRIEVLWSVKNTGTQTMYFQIGAHPGFNYPDYDPAAATHAYLALGRDALTYRLTDAKGCLLPQIHTISLKEGILPLDAHTFDRSVMVIEDDQLQRVALLDGARNPYLALHFDAPVAGLWSPPQKNAPFVCIEPWFGCCDRSGFVGDYNEKEWMQQLEPQAVFNACYTIEIAPAQSK